MKETLEHIMDTLAHKKYVLEACSSLIKYLYNNDRENDAIALARRCSFHDNSKFLDEEMYSFTTLPPEKETMKNPKKPITKEIENVISIHWKNNPHHPEYYNSYKDMSEIDVMEMVCDWYARSLQYQTNFLEFVETRQQTRFQFDEDFYDKVYRYCEIIAKNEL